MTDGYKIDDNRDGLADQFIGNRGNIHDVNLQDGETIKQLPKGGWEIEAKDHSYTVTYS